MPVRLSRLDVLGLLLVGSLLAGCGGSGGTKAAVCGDGLVTSPEQCDDGNAVGGDGCDATCAVEAGFACSGEPSTCARTCGDGVVGPGETCDDENTASGDGCDEACQQEPGWACTGEPSKCAAVCGDGVVAGDEACDDHNTTPGDGCDATCHTETGWTCTDSPSVCTPVCGDGVRLGPEECDDGNLSDADACSSTCTLACGGSTMVSDAQSGSCYDLGDSSAGLSWADARLACAAVGPGFDLFAPASSDEVTQITAAIVAADATETGYWTAGTDAAEEDVWIWANGESWTYVDAQPPWATGEPDNAGGDEDCADLAVHGDGSSALGDEACSALHSYVCERVVGTSLCRNGVVEAPETCDDGNLEAGDGCDVFCHQEAGWDCQGSPSVCAAVCGDGLVRGAEACDDHNTTDGDGCDSTCAIEPGFVCTGEPSQCSQSCGDGVIAPGEECDDGDTAGGDGCSANCKVEHGFTCAGEPSVCASTCGDGLVASDEECDDQNTDPADGCDACTKTQGYSCGGEPSECEQAAFVERDYLDLPILDNVYDGSLGSMSCVDLVFAGFPTLTVGAGVSLEVSLDHSYIGDLTIKVVSPTGTVGTALQRPAGDRANPPGDDGEGCCGDDSNLATTSPIVLDTASSTSAETMGLGLGDSEVVGVTGPATFAPTPDQAADGGFADFAGEAIDGTWQVCFGDSMLYDIGLVKRVKLRFQTQ